jgi:phosphoribosylformylglycinamidine synthase subunit PurQ / glutaminase
VTRIAVVQFPGSNCEQDVVYAARSAGADAELVFHLEEGIGWADAVILPGGFAHGDYLRTGAIARFSPVMADVHDFAITGRPVLGICNGFQILAEAGLVPGALNRNVGLRFICDWTDVEIADNQTPFTRGMEIGQILRIPINHYEGNYTPGDEDPRVVFRYTHNPNGSWDSVAGVSNKKGNVVGLMPHPERACEPWLGSADGAAIFASLVQWCREGASV